MHRIFKGKRESRREQVEEGLPSRQLKREPDSSPCFLPQAGLFIILVTAHRPSLGARQHVQAPGYSPEQDLPGFCFSGVRNGEENVGNRK